MNSTETKASCTREIQVEVPVAEVEKERESLLKRYQKTARIPGFRPGKVPATVLRAQFGAGLLQEAAENLMNRVVPDELKKQNFEPVSQPRIVDMHLHEGEPLRFKATFEVMPEIEISDYKNLGPEPQEIAIADQEIEDAINRVREQHATYDAVTEERTLQDGDFAQIGFEGTPKTDAPAEAAAPAEGAEGENAAKADQAAQPVKVEEVLVEVGGSNTVKEFSENLRGAKAGETREFDVTYPQDFADQRLAGKTFSYTVSIKGIKTKSVPELNNDFAKEVGDFESLEALRNRIREGMEHERKHQAEHEAKDKIVDELLKKAEFPVPEVLVEEAVNQRLERGLRALAAQGLRAEDMRKMDFGRLRAGQREAAEREVKASLVLDKIADLENIQVSDEELDKEVQALAVQYKQPEDQIRARLTQDGTLDRIKNSLRNQKTLDHLYRRSA